MSEVIISVSGLGKSYRLTHEARADTLRDTLVHGARGFARRLLGRARHTTTEEFWALRDVSFEVKRGEVIGIIGRNGAGKSTLLKILSRITEPTTGSVRLRGRVASLLEVGTGFHPELTGRENIFLNGAILGMSRIEIGRKFDEIVAFAEVERFLDTPVKHYSSGMYVRLAFAVAAHLEPEILIVDEVLAVGDAAFQKKCLGKMQDVAGAEGRTVLFVSHNVDAVMQLCSSSILLQNGCLTGIGPTEEIMGRYLNEHRARQGYTAPPEKRHGILSVEVQTPTARSADLTFKIKFACATPLQKPTLGGVVYSIKDVPLFGSNTLFHPWPSPPNFGLAGEATLTFRHVPLWSGAYKASFWLSDGGQSIDAVPDALAFELVSSHLPANAPPPKDIGAIHVPGEWAPHP
jgi:lipopolysaccharide transport system ATP-binding protein